MNTKKRNISIYFLVIGLLISSCGSEQLIEPQFAPIAAGGTHTCVLTSDGKVKCWGNNEYGSLGDGSTTQRLRPVDVIGLSNDVKAIVAGVHTCILTSSGGVKCWGRNVFGELGDGTNNQQSKPVDVIGLTSGVITISASGEHTCALTSEGRIKCWGYNGYGDLGDGTNNNQRVTPVDVIGLSDPISAIAVGQNHMCALISNNGVKCWGAGSFGALGNGTIYAESEKIDVIGLSSGIKTIVAGGDHTCALTSSGGVKCWGRNEHGELGNGTTTGGATPAVDVIGLTSGVVAIVAGYSHTCALTTNGGVKCWGNNENGQLGNGTFDWQFTPVDVKGLTTGVRAISAGGRHTCAITIENIVKCWGDNKYGQLGNGTTSPSPIPVDVKY